MLSHIEEELKTHDSGVIEIQPFDYSGVVKILQELTKRDSCYETLEHAEYGAGELIQSALWLGVKGKNLLDAYKQVRGELEKLNPIDGDSDLSRIGIHNILFNSPLVRVDHEPRKAYDLALI